MQALLGQRYRLVDRIGRGGMGTVWHARDELLGRDVAVKEVLLPDELHETERELLRRRAMREARAAARLSHRNVVTVYDVLEEGGRPWIVMELMRSRSLADVVRDDGPLPPERVAAIGLEVLDALGAAHAAGVLHRDVKPSNVLLAEDGRVVLTDFGIANVEGDPTLTATGLLLGAPAYMAPERARGELARPEADLWSLGATLYTAVEGHPPFDAGGPMPTLAAVVTQPPEPMDRAGRLRPVLEGLLRKDPAERLSAAETRKLLHGIATGPAEEGPPPPPSRRAPWVAWERRAYGARRRAGMGAVLVGIALVVATVLGLLATRSPQRDAPPAEPAAAPLTEAPATLPPTAEEPEAEGPPAEEPAAQTPAANELPEDQSATGTTDLPEGFSVHEDPTGFSVAVPDDWDVSREGTVVVFREPATGRFLLVDQTDDPQPDPVEDWRRQEAARAGSYDDYERIRIESVDYFDAAADWEFTYAARGGRVHVLNRGFVAGDRGYALYWSTPQDRWGESRELFEVFARTFEPAG